MRLSSSAVSRPARPRARAWAREPAMSSSASRQSNCVDFDRRASSGDGPEVKRPPHRARYSVFSAMRYSLENGHIRAVSTVCQTISVVIHSRGGSPVERPNIHKHQQEWHRTALQNRQRANRQCETSSSMSNPPSSTNCFNSFDACTFTLKFGSVTFMHRSKNDFARGTSMVSRRRRIGRMRSDFSH